MAATDVTSLATAYQPAGDQRAGLFIVLEGISGSGKSTLAALLARQLKGRWFHTVPAPVSDLQSYVNANARPLPQLAFYLAGVLHASDLARSGLREGHVVADRYVNSVIANHAAVHGLDNDAVSTAIAPFTRYLAIPDMTVYLHASSTELARRMRAKSDQTAATGTFSPTPSCCSACRIAMTRWRPATRPHGTCRPPAGHPRNWRASSSGCSPR